METLNEHHRAARAEALAQHRSSVTPNHVRVTETVSVNADAVPAGETIRAWLPFPRELPGQQDREARNRRAHGADDERPRPIQTEGLENERPRRKAREEHDRIDGNDPTARRLFGDRIVPCLSRKPRQRKADAHQQSDNQPRKWRRKCIKCHKTSCAHEASKYDSGDRAEPRDHARQYRKHQQHGNRRDRTCESDHPFWLAPSFERQRRQREADAE